MIPIDEVNNKPIIRDAEFVKIVIAKTNGGSETLTFSNAFRDEIINGNTYLAVGGLMGIGSTQRSVNATSYDLNIVLTGIDSSNIYAFLSPYNLILGSTVEIYRGFYNDNYVLTGSRLRFKGIITNFNIAEDLDIPNVTDVHSVTFTCQNLRSVLESRVTGRVTNGKSWKRYSANDISMDRVVLLESTSFDFGKPVSAGATNTTSSSSVLSRVPAAITQITGQGGAVTQLANAIRRNIN